MQENEEKSKYEFSLLVPSQCQQRFLGFCVCIALYKEGLYMNEHQTEQINIRSEFSCLLKNLPGFWVIFEKQQQLPLKSL